MKDRETEKQIKVHDSSSSSPESLLWCFGKDRQRKTTIMTSSPSAATSFTENHAAATKYGPRRERERHKWGRVLSKPDEARSSFPLPQFLEMMSLFIKKNRKRKMCLRLRLDENKRKREKVGGEGGKAGGRERC